VVRSVVDRLVSTGWGLPGIESIAVATGGPFFGIRRTAAQVRTGEWEAAIDGVQVSAVTSEYFRALRIPTGRSTGSTDAGRIAAGSVLIDREFARRLPKGVDPTATVVALGGEDGTYRIAGVVGGTRDWARQATAAPHMFVSFEESPSPFLYVLARFRPGVAARPDDLRRWLREETRGGAMQPVVLLDDLIKKFVATERFVWNVAAFLALAAVVMAGCAVYAATRYAIEAQRRHFAIRVALGATTWQLLRIVSRHAAAVVGLGWVAGLGLGAAMGFVARSFLFEISPWDSIVVAATVVLAVACLALAVGGHVRRVLTPNVVSELRGD
jgi:hypothetical protein